MSWRLFVAAFLTDASLYLAFAALPFRAIELGAASIHLGILPTLYALAYMTTATLGGRLSDRIPRLRLARGACALFFLGCLALASAPRMILLFLAIPILGTALGFFWSPVQAALSDRTREGGLSRSVSAFNVSWSLGKGMGLVAGGFLTEALEPQTALLAAGFPVLVTFLILPRSSPVRSEGPPRTPIESSADDSPPSDTFLKLAWMTNAVAFGVGSTMNVHAPKLLLERGAGASEFGVIFGSVFVVQTLTFAALTRHRPRRSSLMLACAMGAVALFGFLLAPGIALRLLSTVPLGVALGLAYQTSIHTSLDRVHGRGKAAGSHETLLGAGSSSLPLLGGALVHATGSLIAPFLLGSGLLMVGLVITATVRARR
jgi:MFS family permease